MEALNQSSIEQHNPTAKELDQLVIDIFEQRKKIEEMDALTAIENNKLSAMKQKAVLYLEELGRENYKLPGSGTIGISEKWRFSLPKTDEDKAAFFSFLKEKGLFEKYATVNSTSYNSYLNSEWETAKEEGRGMEFQIPGVPEPTFYRDLSIRKG